MKDDRGVPEIEAPGRARGKLSRLLRPRSIAVLGGRWAGNVVEQCRRMGFERVQPVHPTRPEIGDVPTVPTLADLPEPPDAVFLGVNRDATVPLVRELREMGAGGAICFAAGWAEAGEAERQAALVEAAGDMPILGPNCYGLLNYLDGAVVWPDQHGGRREERGVGIVAQSSNIAINLSMQGRGLPIGYVACLGNAAQVGLADLAGAMLEDERVTALGIHAEGIGDASALAALVEEAHRTGRDVVVLKGGRSAKGAGAAASHTAALAGEGAASEVFLRRIGAVQVRTPEAFVEALGLAHVHGPVRPRRVASMSCSGGEAGLVADLAADAGLDLAPMPEETAATLTDLLGQLVAIANPLDYHTFVWGDGERMARVFGAVAGAFDATMLVIDPPDRVDPSSFEHALNAAAEAAEEGLVIPVASLPENMAEARARALTEAGLPPIGGLATAVEVLAALHHARAPDGWCPLPARPMRETALMPEDEAKRIVSAAIDVPRGVVAADLVSLAERARALSPPFALKALGHAHKTEVGAVRLGVTDIASEPPMEGTGYLAEEMAEGIEILVGLRRDPVHGASLTLGAGGVLAEVMDDTATLILPVTKGEVEEALGTLRIAPLLAGFRGRPGADVPVLLAAIHALCDLFMATEGLEEIELNPIMAGAKPVAVDVLMRRA